MAIEPISLALANASTMLDRSAPSTAAAPSAGTAFKDLVADGISQLDGQVQQANQALDQLALGSNVSAQDVMIAMGKARLSLEIAVQVRNRLVDAYQEFMRMQV